MNPAAGAEPVAATHSINVSDLQEQLKSIVAERDRHAFEKSEIVEKANAIARERDDLRQRLSAATTERDRLAAEAAKAASALADAVRRAEKSAEEILGLRKAIDTAPSADPVDVLWTLVSQKTQECVGWLRGKIPPDHPGLAWFDATIATLTKAGCLALQAGRAGAQWARETGWPLAKELAAKAMSEVETRLAKK
ncbi:MAG: hypothetical protein WB816_08705 [Methylocystis sp.]